MPFPDSAFAVVSVVVFLLPGLVFSVVRTTFRGFRGDDKRLDTRIAQAVVISVLLDAVYLFFVYGWVKGTVNVTGNSISVLDPIRLAWIVLGFGVALPGLMGALVYAPWRLGRRPWDERKEDAQHKKSRLHREAMESQNIVSPRRSPYQWKRKVRYSRTPTAWDHAATESRHRMVRIKRANGDWIGGFYGPGSFVSTYPEPRDMFIRWPYEISTVGVFGDPIEDSAGIWLLIGDGDTVEWVEPKWKKDKVEPDVRAE